MAAEQAIEAINKDLGDGDLTTSLFVTEGKDPSGLFFILRNDFSPKEPVDGIYKGAYRFYIGDTKLLRNKDGNTFRIRMLTDNARGAIRHGVRPGTTETDEMILLFDEAIKKSGFDREVKMYFFNATNGREGLDTDPIVYSSTNGAEKLVHLLETLSELSMKARNNGIETVVNSRVEVNADGLITIQPN